MILWIETLGGCKKDLRKMDNTEYFVFFGGYVFLAVLNIILIYYVNSKSFETQKETIKSLIEADLEKLKEQHKINMEYQTFNTFFNKKIEKFESLITACNELLFFTRDREALVSTYNTIGDEFNEKIKPDPTARLGQEIEVMLINNIMVYFEKDKTYHDIWNFLNQDYAHNVDYYIARFQNKINTDLIKFHKKISDIREKHHAWSIYTEDQRILETLIKLEDIGTNLNSAIEERDENKYNKNIKLYLNNLELVAKLFRNEIKKR